MTKITTDALDDATVECACRAICADYGWDADEPVRYAGTRTISRNPDGSTIPQWRMHERDVRTALTSARLASTSPAPDGWVLVPIEPTDEMLNAPSSIVQKYAAGLIWKRMVAYALVAPQPVVEKDNG